MGTRKNFLKGLTINKKNLAMKIIIYVVLLFIAYLMLVPFIIMLKDLWASPIPESVDPRVPVEVTYSWKYFFSNINIFKKSDNYLWITFKNSFIVATSSTLLNVFFSALTAYAITAYEWKLRQAFSNFILAIILIPSTLTTLGFIQLVYKFHLSNKLFVLFLPAIATPMTVFFMRQYLIASLSRDIIHSARMDGSNEFRTFVQIILPLMKPAIATQAIFAYVASWNNLFVPLVVLTEWEKKTLVVYISQGASGRDLLFTVLPLIIIYVFCSKYIVESVGLGAVKG
ncbi:MAG: carbohydrate ABC transporter permease [Clostridiales bacterium]|nr:carbohydrate ABC transporter permease [Clostridiales bacterium]